MLYIFYLNQSIFSYIDRWIVLWNSLPLAPTCDETFVHFRRKCLSFVCYYMNVVNLTGCLWGRRWDYYFLSISYYFILLSLYIFIIIYICVYELNKIVIQIFFPICIPLMQFAGMKTLFLRSTTKNKKNI